MQGEINLAELESAHAIMTGRGVFALGPHPSDPQQRPLIPLYLGAYAHRVAGRARTDGKGPADVHYIAEINALREFVKAVGDGVIWVVIAGDDDITDQVELAPSDLLARLPSGTQYGFAYEPTGEERFSPGDVSVTPGVHEALGPRVGETVQRLLEWHLSGFHGSVKGEDLEANVRQIEADPEAPYVMSVYPVFGDDSIWIISQYGKTYVLLPSEY